MNRTAMAHRDRKEISFSKSWIVLIYLIPIVEMNEQNPDNWMGLRKT